MDKGAITNLGDETDIQLCVILFHFPEAEFSGPQGPDP